MPQFIRAVTRAAVSENWPYVSYAQAPPRSTCALAGPPA
jgi:hypothetical protein